jgi:hypothetical protein
MENQITPNPQNNLFEVSLSAEGAGYLNRVYRITRWVFIVGIFFSVVQLVNIGIRFRMYGSSSVFRGSSDWLSILTKIYPVIEIITVILALAQLYFFYNFTRIGNKSIEVQQSDLFNESFKWLLRNSLVAIIMFVLDTIMLCFATYSNFKILANMH